MGTVATIWYSWIHITVAASCGCSMRPDALRWRCMDWKMRTCIILNTSLPRRQWGRTGAPGGDGRIAALCGCPRSGPRWTAGAAWSPPSRDVGWTSLLGWRKGPRNTAKAKRRQMTKSDRGEGGGTSLQQKRPGVKGRPNVMDQWLRYQSSLTWQPERCARKKHRCDCNIAAWLHVDKKYIYVWPWANSLVLLEDSVVLLLHHRIKPLSFSFNVHFIVWLWDSEG